MLRPRKFLARASSIARAMILPLGKFAPDVDVSGVDVEREQLINIPSITDADPDE